MLPHNSHASAWSRFSNSEPFVYEIGWSLINKDGIFSASDRKAPQLSYQGFLPVRGDA